MLAIFPFGCEAGKDAMTMKQILEYTPMIKNKFNENEYLSPVTKVIEVELENTILQNSNVESMTVSNPDWLGQDDWKK